MSDDLSGMVFVAPRFLCICAPPPPCSHRLSLCPLHSGDLSQGCLRSRETSRYHGDLTPLSAEFAKGQVVGCAVQRLHPLASIGFNGYYHAQSSAARPCFGRVGYELGGLESCLALMRMMSADSRGFSSPVRFHLRIIARLCSPNGWFRLGRWSLLCAVWLDTPARFDATFCSRVRYVSPL